MKSGMQSGMQNEEARRGQPDWAALLRVFGDESVFTFAEQEADGGLVVGVVDLGLHGAEVETELAGVLGLKRAGLEFDHKVATEQQGVEEEIDEEIIASHFERDLPSDEGEAGSEFDAEVGDVLD